MSAPAQPLLKAAAQRTPAARVAGRDAGSSKHIPYVCQVDAHTLETRSGELVQVLRLDGKSFETEDVRELDRLKHTRNTLLRAIAGGGYAIWQHIVRRRVEPALPGVLPAGFAAELDRKWFARLRTRHLYVNDLYLSLVRRAPKGTLGLALRAKRALSPHLDQQERARERAVALRELHQQASNLLSKLAPYGAHRLGTLHTASGLQSELLRFLVHLLTGRDRPVALPRAALDAVLGGAVPAVPLYGYLPTSTDFLGSEGFELRGPAGPDSAPR